MRLIALLKNYAIYKETPNYNVFIAIPNNPKTRSFLLSFIEDCNSFSAMVVVFVSHIAWNLSNSFSIGSDQFIPCPVFDVGHKNA